MLPLGVSFNDFNGLFDKDGKIIIFSFSGGKENFILIIGKLFLENIVKFFKANFKLFSLFRKF
jgi:hypothetical protein